MMTTLFPSRRLLLRRLTGTLVAGLTVTWGLAPNANAVSFSEVGDAGNLPALSQAAGVLPLLTTISGTIGKPGDVDMYAVTMNQAGTFSATTVGTPGTLTDTQLFLFKFPGFGIVANDDSKLTLRSTFQGIPVTPGLYFLAVSSFDVDPVSPGGRIFPSFPFDAVFGPTGPGGGSAITDWLQGDFFNGGFGSIFLSGVFEDVPTTPGAIGSYTIALDLAPVPEPATLLLFGTTLAGVGTWAKKRLLGARMASTR